MLGECARGLSGVVNYDEEELVAAARALRRAGAWMCLEPVVLRHALLAAAAADRSGRLVRRVALRISRDAAEYSAMLPPGELVRDLSALMPVTLSRDLVDAEPVAAKWPIAVRFWVFARYAPPEWRPINWPVVRGWVLVEPGTAARLGAEALAQRMAEYVAGLDDIVLGEAWNALRRRGLLDELRVEEPIRLRRVAAEGLPPCIAALIDALGRGENLSHSARFALAAFMCSYLLMLGRSVEEVVDEVAGLFRAAPDYDEKVTRYQVEHICGLRGGMKRYAPPSCQWMKTNNLCTTNCGAKNPIQLVRKRLARKKEGVVNA